MKIAASFLKIKEPKHIEILKLDREDIDLIHVDVMDGIFVEAKNYTPEEFIYLVSNTNHPKDIHLMVSDVKKYVDGFKDSNPKNITFHYEATTDVGGMINYIKSFGIEVGLSIKPKTEVKEIIEYLKYIDLVLVMSVEPGKGGQKFIEESATKIEELYRIREEQNYHYIIEVDGGINNETIKKCDKADICVVGSYITDGDYKERIETLK